MKGTITYRCGHQEEGFIPASEETLAARLAEYARHLCRSSQIEREQQQFEEALQSNSVVYCVTDQNGRFLTTRRTGLSSCRVTVSDAERTPRVEYEIQIAQVTTELHLRNYKDLYWSAKDWNKNLQ